MNITLKMLSCGHVERTTVVHGENTHEYSLWIEHGAYMLRHTVRNDGDLTHNQLYVERVRHTTIKAIRALYRESVAWAGMAYLYHFEHHGHTYTVFASSNDEARSAIDKMHGVYPHALRSLIS
jgi:hypothetical protein